MEDKTIIVKNSNGYNNNNSSSSSSDDDDDDDDEEFRRRRAMRDKKEPEDWDMLVDAFPVLRSFEFRPTSFKNVNVNTHTPLDFARNVELLKYRIRDCIGPDIEKRNPEFNYIVEWFQSLRPVHLCSLWSLASMLATGAVMSQTTFASIWTNDYKIANCIWAQREAFGLLEKIDDITAVQHLKELALLESRKMQKKLYQIVKDSRLDEESFFRRSSALYDKIMQSRHDADMRPDDPEGYERLRRSITDSIGSTAVEIVLSCAHRIEKALAKLLRCAPGIGYWIDMELATDDLVFAILGPNSGSYGNKEVALTFSDTTMYHPDFFVTPGAAMNWYRSAYTYKKCIKLDRTAWLGPSLPWGKGGEVAFDLDKFAPAASPGWAAAFAMEWIARISTKKFIPPEAVTLRSVAEYYATSSQYTTLEAHLPGFLPFVYVDSVCVSEKALRGAPPFILDYVLKINSIRPGFVSVVPDVTKHIEEVTCGSRALMECVKRAHSKECCPQQPQAQPRGNGFSFVVVPGLEECFVPVLITALPCRVSFSVVSKFSDFLITLSDAPVFHAHPSRPALSESGEEHPDPLHELKKRKKKYLREPDVAENVYISRNYDGPQRSDVLTFRIGRDRSAAALPCGAKMAYAPSDRSPPLAACENFVIGTKSDFVFTASEGVVCLTNTSNDKTISVEPYRCTSKHMFLSFSSFAAEPIVLDICVSFPGYGKYAFTESDLFNYLKPPPIDDGK